MKTNSISAGRAVHARTVATTRQLSFRRAWLWTRFLAFATIAFGPRPAQAAVTEAWVQRYGSEAGSEDRAHKVVTDAAGNVIVAGSSTDSQTGSGSDMLIIKYSGAGVPLWTSRYDGWATALAVDSSNNVFVTGYSNGSGGNAHYATIAYSGAGLPLWTNRYNGTAYGWDYAHAVVVDGSGNVFVTGASDSANFRGADYATIAYSGAGVPLWTNRYNGPANSDDNPTAIAVDSSGNVFVTGVSDSMFPGSGSSYDYATVAYSGTGVRLWTKRYNGPANSDDQATSVAVDAGGNVFVTGVSVEDQGYPDYATATIAYSGAGVALWTNRYNGTGNSTDGATAVAVDGSGNVFVTGYSQGDYATIAYSGAGVPLWTNRYNGPANSWDYAYALAVDGSGNVFVTGSSWYGSQSDSDYLTIAYSRAGIPLWTNRYNGAASAVAVDGSGSVFVTGSSFGSGDNHLDYATIAYSGAGIALWTNRYGGREKTSSIANALAVDGSGNVFVTGTSTGSGGSSDYTIAYSGAGVPLWTNRHDGPATAVAVAGNGNVLVMGNSATIAYSGAGVPLWTNRYNGPEDLSALANALAVDGSGNVFVTGSSVGSEGSYDYVTIAYSGTGVPLWTNFYNGPEDGYDSATALVVDGSGNVFVTGISSHLSSPDYVTIAYSGTGVPLWTNRYAGSGYLSDYANAVAVDGSGNVFVTGNSATIAYSGAGVPLWTNRHNEAGNGQDYNATAVAVDASGNVFVTGSSVDNQDYSESATIAYSSAGVPLWTNRYGGAAIVRSVAVAVDGGGNLFVTGNSAMIAYSGAGVPLWTNRYNGPGNGLKASRLAIGSDGAVYVIGASDGLFLFDFVTVKYVWQTEIAIQLLSTIPPEVNLTLSGAPNSSWAIERAPQLTGPWTNINALLIGTNGIAQLQDTNPPSPAGFYRARQ